MKRCEKLVSIFSSTSLVSSLSPWRWWWWWYSRNISFNSQQDFCLCHITLWLLWLLFILFICVYRSNNPMKYPKNQRHTRSGEVCVCVCHCQWRIYQTKFCAVAPVPDRFRATFLGRAIRPRKRLYSNHEPTYQKWKLLVEKDDGNQWESTSVEELGKHTGTHHSNVKTSKHGHLPQLWVMRPILTHFFIVLNEMVNVGTNYYRSHRMRIYAMMENKNNPHKSSLSSMSRSKLFCSLYFRLCFRPF